GGNRGRGPSVPRRDQQEKRGRGGRRPRGGLSDCRAVLTCHVSVLVLGGESGRTVARPTYGLRAFRPSACDLSRAGWPSPRREMPPCLPSRTSLAASSRNSCDPKAMTRLGCATALAPRSLLSTQRSPRLKNARSHTCCTVEVTDSLRSGPRNLLSGLAVV